MEMIDVIGEDFLPTGEAYSKKYIHANLLRHKEVVLWIMNDKNQILLQKRASNKTFYPNMWAIMAGHVQSGENELETVIREAKEEVGLNLSPSALELISITKDNRQNNHIVEYQYFCYSALKEEEYIIEQNELSMVKYVSLEDIVNQQYPNNEPCVLAKHNLNDYALAFLRGKCS